MAFFTTGLTITSEGRHHWLRAHAHNITDCGFRYAYEPRQGPRHCSGSHSRFQKCRCLRLRDSVPTLQRHLTKSPTHHPTREGTRRPCSALRAYHKLTQEPAYNNTLTKFYPFQSSVAAIVLLLYTLHIGCKNNSFRYRGFTGVAGKELTRIQKPYYLLYIYISISWSFKLNSLTAAQFIGNCYRARKPDQNAELHVIYSASHIIFMYAELSMPACIHTCRTCMLSTS